MYAAISTACIVTGLFVSSLAGNLVMGRHLSSWESLLWLDRPWAWGVLIFPGLLVAERVFRVAARYAWPRGPSREEQAP